MDAARSWGSMTQPTVVGGSVASAPQNPPTGWNKRATSGSGPSRLLARSQRQDSESSRRVRSRPPVGTSQACRPIEARPRTVREAVAGCGAALAAFSRASNPGVPEAVTPRKIYRGPFDLRRHEHNHGRDPRGSRVGAICGHSSPTRNAGGLGKVRRVGTPKKVRRVV